MSEAEVVTRRANPVPAHVPPEAVFAFDFHNDPGFRANPQKRWDEIRAQRRVFYTPLPRHPATGAAGDWVFTHAEDIRRILQDPETFRSGGTRAMGKMVGDSWKLVPTDMDPPEHGHFRTLMNPIFSPKRMAALEVKVRERARELIAPLATQKGCEFIHAFARAFPVSIFLELMGLPLDRIDELVEIEEGILHPKDGSQVESVRRLRDYLRNEIEDRRKTPTDDLISFAVQAQVDGRPCTPDEVMGICFMLFIGGLDTVTSTLSYVFKHLAQNPENQAKLRARPELIPDAVEELIRAHSVVTTGRLVAKDVEVAGMQLKAGDYVSMPMTSASRDPDEFAHPAEIDFERPSNRHAAFGYGPHRCIGSHLARREAVIALEEWLKAIPAFRLKHGAELISDGAGVMSLQALPLEWD